jgi:hypothetical protein
MGLRQILPVQRNKIVFIKTQMLRVVCPEPIVNPKAMVWTAGYFNILKNFQLKRRAFKMVSKLAALHG